MFCRNCGHEVETDTEICHHCGVRPLRERHFCQACGVETQENQELCIQCGAGLRVLPQAPVSHLGSITSDRVYDPFFDLGQLSEEQKKSFARHQLTPGMPLWVALLLHFVTFGIFTTIYYGLKHSALPRIKPDDFSAGKGIGFLFIPFFNFYWVFVFWLRLADRLNFQFRLRGLQHPVGRGLVTAICVLIFIPYLGGLINFLILVPALVVQLHGTTNLLTEMNGASATSSDHATRITGIRKRSTWTALACCGFFIILPSISVAVVEGFLGVTRERQQRTLADLRILATELENYRLDHGAYPRAGDMDELQTMLGREINTTDGWGHSFRYDCWGTSGRAGGCNDYALASPGGDGVFEYEDLRQYPTVHFDERSSERDLVLRSGGFVQKPRRRR